MHHPSTHTHTFAQKHTEKMTNTKLYTNTYPIKQTHEHTHTFQQSQTFMMKKSSRMTNTLTSGCSQAAERPRPTGGGDPEIFVQVKLSNREFIHSLGISWRWERDEERNEDRDGKKKSRGKEGWGQEVWKESERVCDDRVDEIHKGEKGETEEKKSM